MQMARSGYTGAVFQEVRNPDPRREESRYLFLEHFHEVPVEFFIGI